MANVTCSRCGNEAEGLERPPMPGSMGAQIVAQVCVGCWREWLGMQVKFINEYRLNPATLEAQELIIKHMEDFFFGQSAAPPPDYVPPTQGKH